MFLWGMLSPNPPCKGDSILCPPHNAGSRGLSPLAEGSGEADTSPEKEPLRLDGPCCKHYEKTFGGISPHIATKLAEAEQDWGEEAVLEAIDIARENDVSNIKYILKILRNKGADLGRQRHERNQTTDEHIDEVFRKAQELYERRNRKKRHANGGLTHVSN